MSAPEARARPKIEVRRQWLDPWEVDTQLRLAKPGVIELGVSASSKDMLSFVRIYSPGIKYPGESDYEVNAEPRNYRNWWVRVSLPEPAGTVLWIGRFKVDRRAVMRDARGPHGVQALVAIGPLQILKRAVVSTSFWWNPDTKAHDELGWVPHVNMHGADGRLRGTRQVDEVSGSPYGYGAGGVWTFRQYLDYLLVRHVEQVGGPTWGVSDPTGILDLHTEVVPMRPSQSALNIVRRLIRQSDGVDFAVIPVGNGWEIKVFALSKDGAEFGTASLPANPDTMEVSPSTEEHLISAELEESALQTVDHLEAIGNRIEAAVTITADEKVGLWTAAAEAAYKAASTKGSPSTADHGLARGDDLFRYIYTCFAAPGAWDWDEGFAAPILNEEGQYDGWGAARQNQIRHTLRQTPLREGVDYRTIPLDESGARDEYRPPFAVGFLDSDRGYVMLDKADHADLEVQDNYKLYGASISALENEWGLLIEFTNGNYVHAKNHWTAGTPSDGDIDPETQGIDYDETYLTIAIETDQRLRCRKDHADPTGDGSRMVIECPGARFHWISRQTVLGVNTDGARHESPIPGVVARNDNATLHIRMAGAIERYLRDRFSADLVYKTLVPSPDWLGRVLVVGPSEGDFAGKWGIVTSVWFDFAEGKSGVKVGYA